MPRLPVQIILILAAVLLQTVQAAALPVPKPPAVGAKGYILEDYHSGRVLAEKNADERLEPASITKLMAAYVLFKEIKAGSIGLADQVTVSERAWRMPGSRMFIEVGKQVSVEDLLKGMIGLPDPEHYTTARYTTARDIARLARALIAEFPEYYKWYSQKSFTYNGITQQNRNKLLWRDPSVDGIKTGHTESAGYCLVTSAQRNGMRLISVVLGTKSEEARAAASQALLNYGFRFYETHKLYDAGSKLADARVWKGERETFPVGLSETLYITIPRGRYRDLKASMKIPGRIIAPVEKGREYGSVQVRLEDELVAEKPLVALDSVAEGAIWQRLLDEARLYFED